MQKIRPSPGLPAGRAAFHRLRRYHVHLHPGTVAPVLLLLQLLRLDLGVLLRLRPEAPMGQPGLSPGAPAAHLRHRRCHHPAGGDPGAGGPRPGVPAGDAGRHGPGVCHRRRHGGSLQGPVLGLLQAALQSPRIHLPHQLRGLGLLLHPAGALPPPAGGGPDPGPARLPDGRPGLCADGGHHRGRGPLLPGRHGPAGGPHPSHRGERGSAAARPAGGGLLRLCRG